MIRVRDDDVLLPSSGNSNPLLRFQEIHRWICEAPDKLIHVPAILVKEIADFPEGIEFIRQETAEGRMLPEIHGREHIDYGKLTYDEVMRDLRICSDFIWNNFSVVPTTWYTPWGASQDHLHEAAKDSGLKLVDCSKITKLQGRYGICQRLKDGTSIDHWDGGEIFMHWWEGGSRLLRVSKVAQHGSWEAAKGEHPKLFRE